MVWSSCPMDTPRFDDVLQGKAIRLQKAFRDEAKTHFTWYVIGSKCLAF
jgi:hypothetical protein